MLLIERLGNIDYSFIVDKHNNIMLFAQMQNIDDLFITIFQRTLFKMTYTIMAYTHLRFAHGIITEIDRST